MELTGHVDESFFEKYGANNCVLRYFADVSKSRWAEIEVFPEDHFTRLDVSLGDYYNHNDFGYIDIDSAHKGQQIELQTDAFIGLIIIDDFRTREDPVREKPYKRVFKKVKLRLFLWKK